MEKRSEKAALDRWLLGLFLVLYFLVLCVLSLKVPADWSLSVPEDRGFFPDEKGRLMAPLFFYEHGVLPTGYEPEVRMNLWGFSYASYPLMLGAVIGGVLMKIAGLFTQNMDWIVFAARMTSICAGTGFAFWVIKIGEALFAKPVNYLFASSIIFLPQIIFCSLYLNNDIVALCGGSMMLYSWILGLRRGWTWPSVVLLSLGVSMVALSYYNAYPWILLSIVMYFVIWRRRFSGSFTEMMKDKAFLRLTIGSIVMVLVIIVPFFVRAAVNNNGDFLGFATVSEMSTKYGATGFKPSQRPTPQHLGMNLWTMLTTDHYLGEGKNWLLYTYRSFIGVLGQMSVFLPRFVYWFYGAFAVIGVVGYIASIISTIRRHDADAGSLMFDVVMLVNIMLVAGLALWYSYATDYQPQGRYVFPMILSLTYVIVSGWSRLLQRFVKETGAESMICGLLCGAMCCTAAWAFITCYLQGAAPYVAALASSSGM